MKKLFLVILLLIPFTGNTQTKGPNCREVCKHWDTISGQYVCTEWETVCDKLPIRTREGSAGGGTRGKSSRESVIDFNNTNRSTSCSCPELNCTGIIYPRCSSVCIDETKVVYCECGFCINAVSLGNKCSCR